MVKSFSIDVKLCPVSIMCSAKEEKLQPVTALLCSLYLISKLRALKPTYELLQLGVWQVNLYTPDCLNGSGLSIVLLEM